MVFLLLVHLGSCAAKEETSRRSAMQPRAAGFSLDNAPHWLPSTWRLPDLRRLPAWPSPRFLGHAAATTLLGSLARCSIRRTDERRRREVDEGLSCPRAVSPRPHAPIGITEQAESIFIFSFVTIDWNLPIIRMQRTYKNVLSRAKVGRAPDLALPRASPVQQGWNQWWTRLLVI
jgi:hypothetical protein